MQTAMLGSRLVEVPHFNTGRIPWNKDRAWSDKEKERISSGRKGKALGNKNALGHSHPLSQEAKDKLSRERKGKKRPPFSREWREKISRAATGRKYPESFCEKSRINRLGPRNPMWKGGIYPANRAARKTAEYKRWRRAVFERDNYTCIACSVRGGTLHADHIKRFAEHEDLRYEVSNGRTMCVGCHRKTDTWGTKTKYIKE